MGLRPLVQEQHANDDTKRVAGIIVVREQSDGTHHVLALLPGKEVTSDSGETRYEFYRNWDIPKGHGKGGEPAMTIAMREAGEEAGYTTDNLDFRWGTQSKAVTGKKGKAGTFFVAHSDVDPTLKRNPDNDMLEHGGFKWVTWDDMLGNVSGFWFSDAIAWARDLVDSPISDGLGEGLLRSWVREILAEAPRRGKRHDTARKEREELEVQGIFPTEEEKPKGDKRDLWHIGPKPAYPQPKMKYLQDWDSEAIGRDGEKGDWVGIPGTDNWQRWWLDSPVKSGVFLTPTPTDIARYHGRTGNVYHYKVPEWVIDKAKGIHRYDHGSEVLISKEIWDEAGDEIEFVGTSMTKDQLWQKIRGMGGSWFSGRGKLSGKSKPGSFNLGGLRQTKHPRDAVKLMTDEERKAALTALEDLYPTPAGQNPETKWEKVPGNRRGIPLNWFEERMSKKDLELMDLLTTSLKSVNEATIRQYVRGMLLLEKMKTGRALDWYATQISREIVNAIKDDGIKQAVQDQGSVKFQMNIPEILDDLEWLEAVTIDIQGNLSDYVDAVAKYGFDINADDKQRKTSDIHVEILLPDDYSDSVLSRLVPKLKGVLRHELEHAGQPTEMLMKTQEKIPEGDIWKSLQSAEDYYLSEAEGKAHVAEFVKIAKTEKRPASQVIDEELVSIWQTGLAAGFSEAELEPLMKRIREAYHFYLQSRWPDAALENGAD